LNREQAYREEKKYPSDLSNPQWAVIQRYFPRNRKRGRPPVHTKLIIINAIMYILSAGCAWRLLPNDFPPWRTVYHYFRMWRKSGLWKKLSPERGIQKACIKKE
jgi:putative transposase